MINSSECWLADVFLMPLKTNEVLKGYINIKHNMNWIICISYDSFCWGSIFIYIRHLLHRHFIYLIYISFLFIFNLMNWSDGLFSLLSTYVLINFLICSFLKIFIHFFFYNYRKPFNFWFLCFISWLQWNWSGEKYKFFI